MFMGIQKRRITILGSTGSIGVSTLEVISRHADRFDVFALSAATQLDKLLQQCVQFKPAFAVMTSESHARELEYQCGTTLPVPMGVVPLGAALVK